MIYRAALVSHRRGGLGDPSPPPPDLLNLQIPVEATELEVPKMEAFLGRSRVREWWERAEDGCAVGWKGKVDKRQRLSRYKETGIKEQTPSLDNFTKTFSRATDGLGHQEVESRPRFVLHFHLDIQNH